MPFTQTFNINEMVNCIQLRTIKDIQVQRIDVKPSIVVVVEDVAGAWGHQHGCQSEKAASSQTY